MKSSMSLFLDKCDIELVTLTNRSGISTYTLRVNDRANQRELNISLDLEEIRQIDKLLTKVFL